VAEQRLSFTVTLEDAGERLDAVAARETGLSRSRIVKLIERGLVLIGEAPAAKSSPLTAGLVVTVRIPPPEPVTTAAENIPLEIKFEDADIIVLSKPAGLVTHPAPGHRTGTLVNALLGHTGGLSSVGGTDRPGIVHRLDKDTSGLMLVAKTDAAHQGLSNQLKNRTIGKTYTALVRGQMPADRGVIEEPIGRHPKDRKKMAVAPKRGRVAETRWRVVDRYVGYCLVELSLMTGRTHQIRVHLLHLGHPVAGDPLYGGGDKADAPLGLKRQFLHASGLSFTHPVTGERMTFTDELPADLAAALKKLHMR
jgi:23S rRNA pseudouridine1911/1915/1917 synthase